LQKLELIIKQRRLRWLGHVLRIEDFRIPRQAIQWELRGYKRTPGRPRKHWMDITRRDLKDMDITWDEAKELATMASTCGPMPNAPIWMRDELRSKVRSKVKTHLEQPGVFGRFQ